MMVFSTPLVNWRASNLLAAWLTSPPFLSLCDKYRGMYIFIQCVTGGGGGGSDCVESIYRSYTLCIRPESEPTKLLYLPKPKPGRGGGLRQINSFRQIPLQVNFLKRRPLGFHIFLVIWSMSWG
jgi:hypothetical protein